MNCKQFQKETLKALAAGNTASPEVAAHVDCCTACHEFDRAQRFLFRSVDAGLRAIANEPVPASLLPGVRARLDTKSFPARVSFAGRNLAFVAASAVLLAVAFGYTSRRFNGHGEPRQTPAVSTHLKLPVLVPASAAPSALPEVSVQKPRLMPRGKTNVSTSPALFNPSEKRAFAQLVAEPPPLRDGGLAGRAPGTKDDIVEISLVEIDDVNVKPLDPKDGQ